MLYDHKYYKFKFTLYETWERHLMPLDTATIKAPMTEKYWPRPWQAYPDRNLRYLHTRQSPSWNVACNACHLLCPGLKVSVDCFRSCQTGVSPLCITGNISEVLRNSASPINSCLLTPPIEIWSFCMECLVEMVRWERRSLHSLVSLPISPFTFIETPWSRIVVVKLVFAKLIKSLGVLL
jgi:hypothetical protein